MAKPRSVLERLLERRQGGPELEVHPEPPGRFLQAAPRGLEEDLAWVGYRYRVELTDRGRRALKEGRDG